MTTDMSTVIVPKSDQMNADTLLGGPRTITIRDVSIPRHRAARLHLVRGRRR